MAIDEELSELRAWVLGERPLPTLLDRVAEIGRAVLPHADEVSVILASKPHEATIGATDPIGRELDERQRELGRGPCLDAAYGGTYTLVIDFAEETRWPNYSPQALQLGVRSSISTALPVQDRVVGAIDWYSRSVGAFSEADRGPVADYAGHVAALITNAHLYGELQHTAENMKIAMASRAVIEQAKGVIMATSHCDPDKAFRILAEQSQHENRKLHEIAQEIVARQQR